MAVNVRIARSFLSRFYCEVTPLCLTMEQATCISKMRLNIEVAYTLVCKETSATYIVRFRAFYFTATTPCLQLSSDSRISILTRCRVWNKYRSIFIAGVFEFIKIHIPLQYDAQKIITETRIAQLLWRNMMAKSKYSRKLLIVWGKTIGFDFNQNNSIFLLNNFILLVSKLRFIFLQLTWREL